MAGTGRLRHYPNVESQVRMSGPPGLNLLEDLGFVNLRRFARQFERDACPSGFVGRLAVTRWLEAAKTWPGLRAQCRAMQLGLAAPRVAPAAR